MNRVKVWAYAAVVAAVAVAALRAGLIAQRADAIAALDARLAVAAAHAGAAIAALGREASAAAAVAARDAALVEALHPKEVAPAPLPRKRRRAAPVRRPPVDVEATEGALRDAARAARARAEKALGFALPEGTVVTAGNRAWLSRKGEPGAAEGEAMGLLRAAIAGNAHRGFVRLNGAGFHAAAAPVGDAGGLVVLAPLDERWVRSVAAGAGAEVTLSVPEVKPISTLAGDAAQPFTAWTFGAGAGTDVGRLAPVTVRVGPVKLPPLPQPWGAPAAYRARAVPLEGVEGGYVVLALSTAAPLGALASTHYLALGIVVALLLAGIVVGLLVRGAEAAPAVPDALLAAATRIERGDFAARAPKLAGRFGTLASALNRAAELAGPAAAVAPGGTDALVAQPLPPPPSPPPLSAAPADLLREAALSAPAAPAPTVEVDEEAHWQQIFQDFLRTRASCGEPTEGLTYEKFRLKLEGNKAALVSKYACRSVRFLVYVKEGKAALKATPVR